MEAFLLIECIIMQKHSSQIDPSELQLNKAIPLIPKPRFWIYNNIVSTKIFDKRDDFDFLIYR